MAKISARGETEHLRFEGEGGAAIVLTIKKNGKPGRVLHKLGSGWAYNLVKTFHNSSLDYASEYVTQFADERQYARVGVRS